jgi:hypothetical protein
MFELYGHAGEWLIEYSAGRSLGQRLILVLSRDNISQGDSAGSSTATTSVPSCRLGCTRRSAPRSLRNQHKPIYRQMFGCLVAGRLLYDRILTFKKKCQQAFLGKQTLSRSTRLKECSRSRTQRGESIAHDSRSHFR